MPKPIYMTEEMVKESFTDLRKSFEEAFAKAMAASASKKLADGKFEFTYPGIAYTWQDDDRRATVKFTEHAYAKMITYVMICDKEIGWHGTVERGEGDNVYIVSEMELFPQTVTGSNVDADASKYPLWAMGKPNEELKKLRFHGHSHVNMAVSPSSVDMTYRKNMIGQYKDGFYIFLIINKKLEVSGQVYDFDDNVLFTDKEIDWVVGLGLTKQVRDEKEKFVKTTTYSYGGGYNGSYGAGSYGRGYGSTYSKTTALSEVGGGSRDFRKPEEKPETKTGSETGRKKEEKDNVSGYEDGDRYYGRHTYDPYDEHLFYDEDTGLWYYDERGYSK